MQIFWHQKCMVFVQKSRNSLIYSSSTEMRKNEKKPDVIRPEWTENKKSTSKSRCLAHIVYSYTF